MRFVIHHHTGNPREDEHYDLMLEEGDHLVTWRISIEGMGGLVAGRPAEARRINDHRREYLSYEGPISCDRGMVRIMDAGSCEKIAEAEGRRDYAVEGRTLHGVLTMVSSSRGSFSLTYLASK